MRDVKLLIKNGVILTSAILFAGGLSFTSLAATDDVASGEGDGAIQQAERNDVMGYNARDYGLNVHGVGEDGEYIRSTYGDYDGGTYGGYGTFVNNTSSGTINGNDSFSYGTPYEHNGATTTIIPHLYEDAVSFDYNVTNNTDQPQTFVVGSGADTMIGGNDRAIIYGDENAFTMTDGEYAMQISSGDHPFDNLWYGRYYDRDEHFGDNTVMTSQTQGEDSGVIWGWNITLDPGQSATRSAGVRIGEHSVIIRTDGQPQYVDWGPGPEKAPDIWFALTDAGNDLPIPAMGKASANTFTMFANISGCTYGQIRDALKASYEATPAGGVFVFGTTEVSLIDAQVAETLSSRSDVAVNVVYTKDGQQFQVNIPAGTDFKALLDDNGYCGFLGLAAKFGAKAIG